MARFESSRGRDSGRDSRNSSPRRDNRGRGGFDDHRGRDSGRGRDNRGRGGFDDYRGRDSGRGRGRDSRDRSNFEMTKVICSDCGAKCEVPFKPTSTKPVYCDDCFAKKGKNRSRGSSNKDLEIINEKLDKIMEALDIDTKEE